MNRFIHIWKYENFVEHVKSRTQVAMTSEATASLNLLRNDMLCKALFCYKDAEGLAGFLVLTEEELLEEKAAYLREQPGFVNACFTIEHDEQMSCASAQSDFEGLELLLHFARDSV
jgi:hypothetical protein